MPAKDIFHDIVKRALQKDGWVITHDPLFYGMGRSRTVCGFGRRKTDRRLMSGHIW